MRKLTICLGCLILILLSVSTVFSRSVLNTKLIGKSNLSGFGGNVFLHGFQLGYNKWNTDNHVRAFAVFPGNNTTTVNLSDKNASGKNDIYGALISADYVPNKYGLQIKKGECKAQCNISLSHKPNHTIFIRGFSFTRKGKEDMHIKRIAIKSLEPGRSGKTFIAFRDKDKKDKFKYEIWYSNVPNYQIKQKVVLSKNAKDFAKKKYVLSNPSLRPGIVSFSFMFRSKDHELRDIEFGLYGKPAEKNMGLHMVFSDKNGDDKVNYYGAAYYFDPYYKPEPKGKTYKKKKMPIRKKAMPIRKKKAIKK